LNEPFLVIRPLHKTGAVGTVARAFDILPKACLAPFLLTRAYDPSVNWKAEKKDSAFDFS